MAMVLDAFASYLQNMLMEMANEEMHTLLGVKNEIDWICRELVGLQCYFEDADSHSTRGGEQLWVEALKDVMYEATDIVDLCQLKAMERGLSTVDVGCFNPLLFFQRNPIHAHNISGRIKRLHQCLEVLIAELNVFGFRWTARHTFSDRSTSPFMVSSDLVGHKIEDDTRVLVEKLTEGGDNSDSIMVIAIVGVGGIGKTTLGKKVFNDPAIQGKFTKKIWLSITQELNEVELLRTAIAAADGDLPGLGFGAQDKVLLMRALADAITDKKFFLVLDDIWSSNVWEILLMAPFRHGAPGSRVLVTTRNYNVARDMKAKHPYHHVDRLGPEDAWSLLKKQGAG